MACTLHIFSEDFRVDEYLNENPLPVVYKYLKGESIQAGAFVKIHPWSGFDIQISQSTTLKTLISDFETFYDSYHKQLAELKDYGGHCGLLHLGYTLDFTLPVQMNLLPSKFLSKVNMLNIDIDLTQINPNIDHG